MFYICEATLSSPPPVPEERIRDEIHPAHVRFVADGVGKGIVVFGGPKTAGGGGVLLVRAASAAACRAFLDEDPMVRAGAHSFRVTEMRIFEHDPCLDPILRDE